MANIAEDYYRLEQTPWPQTCLQAYLTIDPTNIAATDFDKYWYYKKTDVIVVWNDLTATSAVDVTIKIQKRVHFSTKVAGTTYTSPWVDITGAAYNITSSDGRTNIFIDDFGASDLRITAVNGDCLGGSIEVYLIAKSW